MPYAQQLPETHGNAVTSKLCGGAAMVPLHEVRPFAEADFRDRLDDLVAMGVEFVLRESKPSREMKDILKRRNASLQACAAGIARVGDGIVQHAVDGAVERIAGQRSRKTASAPQALARTARTRLFSSSTKTRRTRRW